MTIFFLQTKQDSFLHLRCIFLFFEVELGLRMHMGKSELISVGKGLDGERMISIMG